MSRQLDLMRLYDDELGPEEAAELEKSLTPEDRELLAGLEQVGDVVRALERDEVTRFEGVADAVLAAIEADPAPAKVVPLGPRVESGGEAPSSRHRRARSGPVVILGLGLAAAAAAALWMSTPGPQPTTPAPVAVSVRPAPPAEAPSAAPEPTAELGDEDADPAASIEAVDFGNQGGTIFMVPAGEESTPVVWLVDEPASARMEPL